PALHRSARSSTMSRDDSARSTHVLCGPLSTGPTAGHSWARRGWAERCSNRLGRYLLSGCGLAQPVVETGFTEHRVVLGDERAFSQHRAEVEGLGIGNDLARVVPRAEELSDQSVTELLGSADFDDAVDRSTAGRASYGPSDII